MTTEPATAPPSDWTAADGISSTSDMFNELVQAVAELLEDQAHALIQGKTERVAGLIVAQLAHRHGLSPNTPGVAPTATIVRRHLDLLIEQALPLSGYRVQERLHALRRELKRVDEDRERFHR